MKIKICDMIYLLDIQNRNTKTTEMMEKYGMEERQLRAVIDHLKAGKWHVVE